MKYLIDLPYAKCMNCQAEFSIKYIVDEGSSSKIHCPICGSTGQFDMDEIITEPLR